MSDFPLSLVSPALGCAPTLDAAVRVSLSHSSWQLRLHHEAGRLGRGRTRPGQPDVPALLAARVQTRGRQAVSVNSQRECFALHTPHGLCGRLSSDTRA